MLKAKAFNWKFSLISNIHTNNTHRTTLYHYEITGTPFLIKLAGQYYRLILNTSQKEKNSNLSTL
jgi:hypothetical protein